MRLVLALASGLLFGLGLVAGGMTDPAKIKAFLDLAGRWDPSLAFVMAGAIAIGLPAFALAKRRSTSWSGERMELPASNTVDRRLLAGGLLFGIGWGIAGFCPGPALVAMSFGPSAAWIFGVAMLAGMVAHDRLWVPR